MMLSSKPIECTEPRVNPKGNYGLWVILMSQRKIILGKKKCAFVVSDVFNGLLLLFSRWGMSDSLWIHGLQHARLPCPSLSSRACWNSCPLNHWCHPIIASSVIPFSSCLQSLPESESFLMSWLFTSGGQSIGASVSAFILPINI